MDDRLLPFLLPFAISTRRLHMLPLLLYRQAFLPPFVMFIPLFFSQYNALTFLGDQDNVDQEMGRDE